MLRRYIASLSVAVLLSLLLFSIMQRLISHSADTVEYQEAVRVDISALDMPEQSLEYSASEPVLEPVLEAVDMAIAVPELSRDFNDDMPQDLPSLDTASFAKSQDAWLQPVVAASAADDYVGERNASKKAMVPISTRRPNIPDIAYENQINGWVLLAFTVNNDGHVSNIRIMDAQPRGIFEVEAVDALKSWRYSPYKGQTVQLSQRIEFEWNMYPYNMNF
jgi:TonB family protein